MKYRYLFIIMIAMFAVAACEHPDNKEEVPAYITENVCYLDATNAIQSIVHSPAGLSGDLDVTHTFYVKLKRESTEDVTAYLDLTSDSDVLTDAYLSISAMTVTIPAGQTEKEVTLAVSNYSPLENTRDAVDANIAVTLVDVDNVYCAQERNSFKLEVSKAAYTAIEDGQPSDGTSISDRSGWTIIDLTTDEDVTSTLTDGKPSTYISGDPMRISIDLAETLTITGFRNYLTSGSYSPQTFTFEYSSDGVNWEMWEENHQITTTSSNTYFTFIGGISCRYLRVTMGDINSRYTYEPRCGDVYLYAK